MFKIQTLPMLAGIGFLLSAAWADDVKPAKPVEKDFVKPTGFTYGPWRSGIVGGGGYVQNVVCCPSNKNRFYTYVDVAGFSRSDDGGKSWRMLHGHLPAALGNYEVRGLTVDPRDDKRIIVATGSEYSGKEGLYLSTDAGETFKKVLEAQYYGNGGNRAAGFILARDPANPDVIVTAAATDGVFFSRDNGQTWTASGGTDLYPCDIRFDRTNSKRLWMCASGGKVSKKEFKGGFYRTDDGGATWEKLGDKSPSEIIQDPKDPNTLLGIFGAEIIGKSTDGGENWTDFSDGLLVEPMEPGKYKDSISKSGYRALAAGPDFILTCNTRDADFFKLPSGGTKWEKVARESVDAGDFYHVGSWYFGGAAGSITVDVNNPDHWFMTDFFAIYQTFDAGKHWRLTVDGMETTVSHCMLQDPGDPGVIHLGLADVGAFSSEDGGFRFRKDSTPNDPNYKNQPAGGGNMKCMDLCPKLPNRIYGVANQSYYNAWQANQVFVSIDRGKTWTRSPMAGLPDTTKQPCTTIVADVNDPNTVYLTIAGPIAPNGGGVYKSIDGGAHWTWMSQGMPDKPWANYYFPYDIWAHGRQLAAGADGNLIAISKQQNLVYRFDPDVQTWKPAPFKHGGNLWCVVADKLKPGRFFVAARWDGLYRTDDNGANWKKVYGTSVSFVATDAAVPGRVAGGTEDGVIVSTDGGETWKTMDKSLPYRVGNIPAFAGDRLFAASAGSGVFWMPLTPEAEKPVTAKPMVPAGPLFPQP